MSTVSSAFLGHPDTERVTAPIAETADIEEYAFVELEIEEYAQGIDEAVQRQQDGVDHEAVIIINQRHSKRDGIVHRGKQKELTRCDGDRG